MKAMAERAHPSTRSRQWLKRTAAASVAVVALVAGAATPAQAAAPRTNSYTPIYDRPSPYGYLYGGIFTNTPVTMWCWLDMPVYTDGTNRWFNITAVGYNIRTGRMNTFRGYVSATRISDQAVVPHC